MGQGEIFLQRVDGWCKSMKNGVLFHPGADDENHPNGQRYQTNEWVSLRETNECGNADNIKSVPFIGTGFFYFPVVDVSEGEII